MNSCVYIPMVNTPAGEKESNLFKDIKAIVKNNDVAWELYGKTLTDKFRQNVGVNLEKDAYGEPTIRSIWQQTNLLDNYIPNKELESIKNANIEIGHMDKSGNVKYRKDTYDNRLSLARDVVKYNSNRLPTGDMSKSKYVGKIQQEIVDGQVMLTAEVVKSSKDLENSANSMKAGVTLHDYLTDYLSNYGVGVGALDETLEQMGGIYGYIDFSEVQNFSSGLVNLIKLSKGEKGQRALPEEFSHFIVAATVGNNFIDRLVRNIADNNLAEIILRTEVYNRVVEQQKGNKDKDAVAKEAAGKLIANALQGNDLKIRMPKSLMERTVNSVAELFGGMSEDTLLMYIQQALEDSGIVAEQILSNTLEGHTSINNITDQGIYFDADAAVTQQIKKVSRKEEFLRRAIDIEKKKYDLLNKAYKDKQLISGYQGVILEMEGHLQNKQEILGLYSFVLTELKFLQDALTDLKSMEDGTFEGNKDAALKRIRNQIFSIISLVSEIQADITEDIKNSDSDYKKLLLEYEKDFKTTFEELGTLLNTIVHKYDKIASGSFLDFLGKYLGESAITAWQNGQKKKFSAQEIFDVNVEDISIMDLWLDAARDSKSPIVQAYDTAIKDAKEASRMDTIEDEKILEAAGKNLEKHGIKNTDWMYEEDENGNATGNFVTKYKLLEIKKAKNELYDRLNKKYNGIKSSEYFQELKREIVKIHDTKTGYINPKFLNPAYEEIMSNPYKKEFYNTVMELKEKLDTSAGLISRGYTSLEHAPRIHRDLIQRIVGSSISEAPALFWESIKDTVIRRSDDTAFGTMGKGSLKDFEDRQVNLLPLFYLKFNKNEKMKDISRDTVSTMVAYSNMIHDYVEMNKIIDSLENGIDVMTDNLKVATSANGKGLVYKFKFISEELATDLSKGFKESNLAKRLDYLMKMNAYGQRIKDQGTFGNTNIDKAKAGGLLLGATAFTGLALNFLAGIANATLNIVNMNTEAWGARFFKPKDLLKADMTFLKLCPEMFLECESRVKTNKLSLINELFDVNQDFDKNVHDIRFRKRTTLNRIFNGGTLYVFTTAGDNWANFRTALSILNAYKLEDKNGKEISLLDALEVDYIDPSNKSLGARLIVSDDYHKKGGGKFGREDVKQLKNLIAYVNQQMFGIYNNLDKNALQQGVLGRMAIMYRKYMRPNFMRRFMSEREITGLGIHDEGYYRTFWKFMGTLIKDMRSLQFHMMARFHELDSWKQANIRKAFFELGVFAIVAFLANFAFEDPDKHDPWIAKLAMYQAKRLYMEMGAFIPPFALQEGSQLMRQPSAAISTADDIIRMFKLLTPGPYTKTMQSGRFKDHSEAYKILMESPLGLQSRSIYRALNPEVTYSFFTWK